MITLVVFVSLVNVMAQVNNNYRSTSVDPVTQGAKRFAINYHRWILQLFKPLGKWVVAVKAFESILKPPIGKNILLIAEKN